MKRAALVLLCVAGAVHLAACSDQFDLAPRSAPSVDLASATAPSALPSQATPALAVGPTPTPPPSATPVVPDSGWLPLREGMEQRVINLAADDGEWLENITILRLDPAFFQFDVGYRPGQPQSLPAWQEQTGGLLLVNGGFFTEANEATGLLISGGQHYGASYEGFGGMFAVTPGGPTLRWLPQQPFDAAEPLQAALQAFPMLLTPGGVPGPTSDDGHRARRTIVAQDTEGRILFLLAAHGHFTLYGLSYYLMASDLGLNTALNLDGGASSGLLLSEPDVYVPAFALLPSVIVVHEK